MYFIQPSGKKKFPNQNLLIGLRQGEAVCFFCDAGNEVLNIIYKHFRLQKFKKCPTRRVIDLHSRFIKPNKLKSTFWSAKEGRWYKLGEWRGSKQDYKCENLAAVEHKTLPGNFTPSIPKRYLLNYSHLTFRWPSIVINSYNKTK